MFSVARTLMQPCPINISKEMFNDNLNLLLIAADNKNNYVVIKDFDKFMHNQTKHEPRKHFCMYCLQCFISEEVISTHQTPSVYWAVKEIVANCSLRHTKSTQIVVTVLS